MLRRSRTCTFSRRLACAILASMKEVLKIVPPPSIPMAVARALAKSFFSTATGVFTLRVHRGHFYQWNGGHWSAMDTDDVRGEVYRQLEHAQYEHPRKGTLSFAPSQGKINNVMDALRAIVELDTNVEAPCWTDAASVDRLPANEIVSMANGLLHIPTRTLKPHTPHFFCHHSLEFAYVPDADSPKRWLTFLGELWRHDESSINALHEMMGYLLGGGTRLQKMFLLVGPKRAGKGTIGRVLTGLLGAHNVAAPTLASLSAHFGLSALIGKPLGLISDVRLSKRPENSIVVERLLSVSGEDRLTIDRKYRKPWTGRLPTRVVVMTNELPRLTDSSGALASRFVVFVLTKSFYRRENPQLTDELLTEAPAIFNWALEGLDRLNQRGYFVEPESGKAATQELEDLSSPVAAFVRNRCVVGRDRQVEVGRLWSAWKSWCETENHAPGTKVLFGRDLHAAMPTVRKTRRRKGEHRVATYEGIGLRLA